MPTTNIYFKKRLNTIFLQMVFVMLGVLFFHNSAKNKCRLWSNNRLFLTLRHHINDYICLNYNTLMPFLITYKTFVCPDVAYLLFYSPNIQRLENPLSKFERFALLVWPCQRRWSLYVTFALSESRPWIVMKYHSLSFAVLSTLHQCSLACVQWMRWMSALFIICCIEGETLCCVFWRDVFDVFWIVSIYVIHLLTLHMLSRYSSQTSLWTCTPRSSPSFWTLE